MIYSIHIENKDFESRVKYVFDFIQNHPLNGGCVSFIYSDKNQHNTISYGSHQIGIFQIPAQKIIFNTNPPHPSTLISNTYQTSGMDVHSVEIKKQAKSELIQNSHFSFDLIETIFFHISRYEEHIIRPDMKSNWGMGFKENHFIPRNRLQETPIVDHLVFAFLTAIGVNPQKLKTTFRLTHDVDNPLKLPSFYKLIKASRRLLLVERKGLKSQLELFKLYPKIKKGLAKDPYDTFDWMFRKETMEKVVYFMAGGVTKFDNFYQIDSPIGKRVLKEAKEKGYKIGLHPSYEANANKELYAKEKKKLEEVSGENIVLARQHYLRFQFPETADIIDSQDIVEDSTLGYRDMIGFRCGTGFGYKLYNFKKEKAYHFTEVPLVIMEWSLIQQNNYDIEEIKNHLNSFFAQNQFFTKITILFHNSIFDMVNQHRSGLKEIYLDIIHKKML